MEHPLENLTLTIVDPVLRVDRIRTVPAAIDIGSVCLSQCAFAFGGYVPYGEGPHQVTEQQVREELARSGSTGPDAILDLALFATGLGHHGGTYFAVSRERNPLEGHPEVICFYVDPRGEDEVDRNNAERLRSWWRQQVSDAR